MDHVSPFTVEEVLHLIGDTLPDIAGFQNEFMKMWKHFAPDQVVLYFDICAVTWHTFSAAVRVSEKKQSQAVTYATDKQSFYVPLDVRIESRRDYWWIANTFKDDVASAMKLVQVISYMQIREQSKIVKIYLECMIDAHGIQRAAHDLRLIHRALETLKTPSLWDREKALFLVTLAKCTPDILEKHMLDEFYFLASSMVGSNPEESRDAVRSALTWYLCRSAESTKILRWVLYTRQRRKKLQKLKGF